MRVPLLCALLFVAAVAGAPTPDRSSLQTGSDVESQPFVEEVVVESVLQVRAPSARQARTSPRVNLQHGTRVYEERRTNN